MVFHAVLEWLERLLKFSFDMGVETKNWNGVCILPLYIGKCDKYERCCSRSAILLSEVANPTVEC